MADNQAIKQAVKLGIDITAKPIMPIQNDSVYYPADTNYDNAIYQTAVERLELGHIWLYSHAN